MYMKEVALNNGVKMPVIGYGTYQTPPAATERCVLDALHAGYQSVDTAQCYCNEGEVGTACRRSGVLRNDLFVTTKLWACRGYTDTLRSIDDSLERLGLDHIDLLLLHEPTGDIPEIYRAMEKACRDGKKRAIGVSNFLEANYKALLREREIVPAVNQVETHVFRQQAPLRALEEEAGTCHESWSPLASGRNGIFSNNTLRDIGSAHIEQPPPNVDVKSHLRLRRGIPHRPGEALQKIGVRRSVFLPACPERLYTVGHI